MNGIDQGASGCGRRRFLHMVGAGVALAACSGSSGAPAAFGDVAAGNVSALQVGSLVPIAGAPACIGRDSGGLYAMTLTCTHEGCDMASEGTVTSAFIDCNCHGSRFDANGAVLRGPATTPLQHFAVSVDAAGNLTVHGGTDVNADTRVTV